MDKPTLIRYGYLAYIAIWDDKLEKLAIKPLRDCIYTRREPWFIDESELKNITHMITVPKCNSGEFDLDNLNHSDMCPEQCECKKYAKYIDPNLVIQRW